MGTSCTGSGEPQKPEEREQTIAKWKAAIEAYDGAIALDSKDADAQYNRDFVKRKLDALEQQQKQEQKKDDPKDDKKDSVRLEERQEGLEERRGRAGRRQGVEG